MGALFYAKYIADHDAYHGRFDLKCGQYRHSTDMCNVRKAWFCDYATWRLEFFYTWLNNFLKYRNTCDHPFEIPECTVTEEMISCVNPEKKVCYLTAVEYCPVCYCSDHEQRTLNAFSSYLIIVLCFPFISLCSLIVK